MRTDCLRRFSGSNSTQKPVATRRAAVAGIPIGVLIILCNALMASWTMYKASPGQHQHRTTSTGGDTWRKLLMSGRMRWLCYNQSPAAYSTSQKILAFSAVSSRTDSIRGTRLRTCIGLTPASVRLVGLLFASVTSRWAGFPIKWRFMEVMVSD